MNNSNIKQYGPLVARLLMSALFIVGGASMLIFFSGTAGYFSSFGIPVAGLIVVIVAVIQISGGVMVATGIHARQGAWILIILTLLTLIIVHTGAGQMGQALSSLSIVGGLLTIVIYGAGPISLKKKCPCRYCKSDSNIENLNRENTD